MKSSKGGGTGMWVIIFIIMVLAIVGIYELIVKSGDHNSAVPSNLPAATSTIATTTSVDTLPADWKEYQNSTFNYRLKYLPTITFSKALTTYSYDNGSPTTYPANTPIQLTIQDFSGVKNDPANSDILISPLYVNISVQKKPNGYTTLNDFVSNEVDQTVSAGQDSAAGVYATSSPITENGTSGYLMVITDGSVVKNRDDKYYFEHGQYVYSFDVAYSGYNYENKDNDEVSRVDIAAKILSSFKFTK